MSRRPVATSAGRSLAVMYEQRAAKEEEVPHQAPRLLRLSCGVWSAGWISSTKGTRRNGRRAVLWFHIMLHSSPRPRPTAMRLPFSQRRGVPFRRWAQISSTASNTNRRVSTSMTILQPSLGRTVARWAENTRRTTFLAQFSPRVTCTPQELQKVILTSRLLPELVLISFTKRPAASLTAGGRARHA
jgi:hypothetical protein